MGKNIVELEGILVGEPKEIIGKSGKPFAIFNLQIDDDVFELCAFHDNRKMIMTAGIGSVVSVDAKLSARTYTDKTGQTRRATNVNIRKIERVSVAADVLSAIAEDFSDIPF